MSLRPTLLHTGVAALAEKTQWFATLMQAYEFIDTALAKEVSARKSRSGTAVACGPGCTACCYSPIPASIPEIIAIRFALRENLFSIPEKNHSPLEQQEQPAVSALRCPFLANATCAIYPVRPFICRRFLVYNSRCEIGENPVDTRPQDVHSPSENAFIHALNMTLPVLAFMGGTVPKAPEEANRTFWNRHTLFLQQVAW